MRIFNQKISRQKKQEKRITKRTSGLSSNTRRSSAFDHMFFLFLVFCAGTLFIYSGIVQGAAVNFTQADWTTLNATSLTTLPQAGWAEYDSKEAGIVAGTDIQIESISGSLIQTSDDGATDTCNAPGCSTGSGFDAGTLTNIFVSDIGTAAAIKLEAVPTLNWDVEDIGTDSAPAFADLDNDGDLDLIIGSGSGISYGYENTEDVTNPTWAAEATWDVEDIGADSVPDFADLDNDGDLDLIIGSAAGISYGYRNTGDVTNPTWAAEAAWDVSDIGARAVPALADLDNDGDER